MAQNTTQISQSLCNLMRVGNKVDGDFCSMKPVQSQVLPLGPWNPVQLARWQEKRTKDVGRPRPEEAHIISHFQSHCIDQNLIIWSCITVRMLGNAVELVPGQRTGHGYQWALIYTVTWKTPKSQAYNPQKCRQGYITVKKSFTGLFNRVNMCVCPGYSLCMIEENVNNEFIEDWQK